MVDASKDTLYIGRVQVAIRIWEGEGGENFRLCLAVSQANSVLQYTRVHHQQRGRERDANMRNRGFSLSLSLGWSHFRRFSLITLLWANCKFCTHKLARSVITLSLTAWNVDSHHLSGNISFLSSWSLLSSHLWSFDPFHPHQNSTRSSLIESYSWYPSTLKIFRSHNSSHVHSWWCKVYRTRACITFICRAYA